jgi:hypothetical protein
MDPLQKESLSKEEALSGAWVKVATVSLCCTTTRDIQKDNDDGVGKEVGVDGVLWSW